MEARTLGLGAVAIVGLVYAGSTATASANEAECADSIVVEDETGVVDELQQAIDMACPGATILVGPGDYQGAQITKTVNLQGSGDSTRIVSGTPAFWDYVGLFIDAGGEANGTTIRDLAIVNDPDAWFCAGILARAADDITVDGLTITDTAQGITNGNGDRWVITHNRIHGFAAPFGGDHLIGIGVWGDSGRYGVEVGAAYDNFVAFNEVTADYDGEYQELLMGIDIGTWPPETPALVAGNQIVHNTVAVSGNADRAIGVNMFDLSTLEYGDPIHVIGNTVEDNDLCGSGKKVMFQPGGIAGLNTVRRNSCAED